MKRWLQTLRDNERAMTWLSRAFSFFAVTLLLVFAYNDGATGDLARYALPNWLYVLLGLPSLALLLVLIGLQTVEQRLESAPLLVSKDLGKKGLFMKL